MLIGIDASRATSAAPTGTETYSRELIRALIAMDRKNQYRLYLARQSTTELFFTKFQTYQLPLTQLLDSPASGHISAFRLK